LDGKRFDFLENSKEANTPPVQPAIFCRTINIVDEKNNPTWGEV